jgi:hypothetical protein
VNSDHVASLRHSGTLPDTTLSYILIVSDLHVYSSRSLGTVLYSSGLHHLMGSYVRVPLYIQNISATACIRPII